MIKKYFLLLFVFFLLLPGPTVAGGISLNEKKGDESDMNSERGEQPVAIDVSSLESLPGVLELVSGKKIVYIGEYHDRFSNHAVELEAIKTFHKKNRKIAIGMEMFQRPFQKALDDYIAGTIDEQTMLKATEYFKRWGFDYNLYRPILAFAREEKIPVIALNVRREIADKVMKGGIGSLSEEEKKQIPLQLDLSDENYKASLHDIFKKHEGSTEMNFDYFYEAQVLWDESMSQSIEDFLERNPDFRKQGQVVVLAGNGHLVFGSGIPKRTFRRSGLTYSTILNDVDLEKDIANYIIYPKPIEGTTSPKIMAVLNETPEGIAVKAFPEGSISEAAGMKVGDIILAVDGKLVTSVDDIRIALLYKKSGDTLNMRVLRKRFLLGTTEKNFAIVL